MDEINSYIYPTIGICIEDIDRLDPKEYKFTIPSINFNKDSSKEDKTELKNQGITNIANDKNVTIGKVEVNNYFMIYIPKEIMSTTYTTVGMSGELMGSSGHNYSKLSFNSVEGSGGGINTNVTIPAHPIYSYTITSIILNALRLGGGIINGIKQTYDSFKIDAKTNNKDSGMTIMPSDRIIEKGSQWIVVFIDGDPSKPAVIARYK